MGGRNHQPCNIYLRESTSLSRALSLAMAHLELANVALEDELLRELDCSSYDWDGATILSSLQASYDALGVASNAIQNLRRKMYDTGFEDLPILRTVELFSLGRMMEADGLVIGSDWDRIAVIMNRDGFSGVVDEFEAQIEKLRNATKILIHSISTLSNVEIPRSRALNLVLEENLKGNFKTEFAKLYTIWSMFQAQFLASSLLSTELWYAFNKYGSLTRVAVALKSA